MDTCAKCGAGLGVGRFCLNCGHPIGAPVSPDEQRLWSRAPATEPRPADPQPAAPQVLEDDPVEDPVDDPVDESGPVLDEDDWLLDDPDDLDDAPPRLHWAAWLAGAAALVLVAYLALTWLADDDDPGDAATTDATSGASSSPAPTEDPDGGDGGDDSSDSGGVTMPEGRPVDVARGATVTVPQTAPPTTDLDGNLVAYVAAQLVDGKPTTAWRMEGDGTGAEIRLVLRQPSVIDRVGLVNGYAKQVGGVDWYPNNRRVLAVRWTFDDGTSVDQTFAERPQLQRLKIDPVSTSAVTLTILEVTPPGAGPLGRDYTTISSVVLSGRPAG